MIEPFKEPERYKHAVFKKIGRKMYLVCNRCDSKIKSEDEFTGQEQMASLGISSIKFRYCDDCLPIVRVEWREYALNLGRYEMERLKRYKERKNGQLYRSWDKKNIEP